MRERSPGSPCSPAKSGLASIHRLQGMSHARQSQNTRNVLGSGTSPSLMFTSSRLATTSIVNSSPSVPTCHQVRRVSSNRIRRIFPAGRTLDDPFSEFTLLVLVSIDTTRLTFKNEDLQRLFPS